MVPPLPLPHSITRPHHLAEIIYKLSFAGQQRCKDLVDDFNNCCKGRSVTMVFMCKGKYNASQDCIHK